MYRNLIVLFVAFMMYSGAQAQSLYMPRDITQAYKNGTRSADGRPGKNYWQNKGRYTITITAMPPDRTIKGVEDIVYINSSPDTIQLPTIKLFLNIHKPGAARGGDVSKDYLTSGMHIDAFSVNGQTQEWPEPDGGVLNRIKLPTPLLPGDSVRLSFTWHFDVSVKSGREGMIDSTTFFLAYFYPRIAVYDDYSGWDRMPFNDQLEFYSDFNDYSVTLNVPKDYIVWGTGTLQKPEALLQPSIAQRFKESLTSEQVVRIVTREDLRAGNITAQNAMNSWQFTATDIADMAFALSNHYVWDGGSTIVDDATKRRASVQAAYNDTATDYRYMVGFGKEALHWFSRNLPGVPYPYEKTTVVQGYAGMEYPMMVNDESYGHDTTLARLVAEHEIAHTWFPFYMGINETRFGFMDEGWAAALELLIGRARDTATANRLYKMFRINPWRTDPGPEHNIPIITPGHMLFGPGLRTSQYGKASLSYLALKDLLGDVLFKKCLHAYMDRWHGKHPIPWDFFNTFNNVSGKDLNWFWNNWYFTFNHIDVAVKSVEKTSGGYAVSVNNIGGFAVPLDIKITFTDGSQQTMHQIPAIWQANQKLARVQINTGKKIRSLFVDGGVFLDSDEADNQWSEK